jgi:hypothetical protein
MLTAVRRLTGAKIQWLVEELGGQSAVAEVLNVHRSRVSRWLAGDEPDPANQAKLDGLEFVVTRLRYHFSVPTARKWLTGINAHLGNRRPVDLVARNRIAEVIAAIEQADLDSFV